jgi:hypothetical protein
LLWFSSSKESETPVDLFNLIAFLPSLYEDTTDLRREDPPAPSQQTKTLVGFISLISFCNDFKKPTNPPTGKPLLDKDGFTTYAL